MNPKLIFRPLQGGTFNRANPPQENRCNSCHAAEATKLRLDCNKTCCERCAWEHYGVQLPHKTIELSEASEANITNQKLNFKKILLILKL